MSTGSNGKFSSAELKRSSSQRALAKSVLKETASRMIDSVERSALTEIFDGGTRRSHTPEEFLAAFKSALNDAAEYAGIRAGREREELLAQLVAVCKEELLNPDTRFDGANAMSLGVDKVSGWT
jgi:hypothetical protein